MALFSYNQLDPSSNRDTVRMLISDTDGSVVSGNRADWSFFLTDGEVDRVLGLASEDVYIAAARCCLMLAANDLIVNKAVKIGQFSTSNEASGHWRELADTLLAQSAAGAEGGYTAELAWDENSYGQIVLNESLRVN